VKSVARLVNFEAVDGFALFAMNMPKRLDMKILVSHTANIDAKNNPLLLTLAIV
jgi:hypothetical protein